MKTLKNIIETYNWLSEAFVHQTEDTTEQDTLDSYVSKMKERIIYYKTEDHEPISKWYYFDEKYKSDIPELIISNTYDAKSDTGILLFKEPVTSIGDYAFHNYNRSSLTSITIPEGVKSIGCAAFRGCSSLTSITIPSSVTSIGDRAFGNCTKLQDIDIPEGVKSIGACAFEICALTSKITIPSSVTSIGDEAFFLCQSLTQVFYKGIEYRDQISLINALKNSQVSLGEDIFKHTKL